MRFYIMIFVAIFLIGCGKQAEPQNTSQVNSAVDKSTNLNDSSSQSNVVATQNVDAFNKYSFSKQFFALLGTQYQFSEMNFDSAFGTIDNNNICAIANKRNKECNVDIYFVNLTFR